MYSLYIYSINYFHYHYYYHLITEFTNLRPSNYSFSVLTLPTKNCLKTLKSIISKLANCRLRPNRFRSKATLIYLSGFFTCATLSCCCITLNWPRGFGPHWKARAKVSAIESIMHASYWLSLMQKGWFNFTCMEDYEHNYCKLHIGVQTAKIRICRLGVSK